jgi:DNA-binding transcriptional regulator LsrR (DeoR family)
LYKPATSREISDALGIKDADKGRALVRRVMAKLAEEGKVKISEAPEGVKAGKVYSLA